MCACLHAWLLPSELAIPSLFAACTPMPPHPLLHLGPGTGQRAGTPVPFFGRSHIPGTVQLLTTHIHFGVLLRYKGMPAATLRENLAYFLRAVVPVAAEGGARMAIHPDDPPLPLFGLPRVVSTVGRLHLSVRMRLPTSGDNPTPTSLDPGDYFHRSPSPLSPLSITIVTPALRRSAGRRLQVPAQCSRCERKRADPLHW